MPSPYVFDSSQYNTYEYILNGGLQMKKTIMKKSLAKKLIEAGHDFRGTEENKRNENLVVYKFTKTPELIADLIRFSVQ